MAIAERMPMMTTTIMTSIKVKPVCLFTASIFLGSSLGGAGRNGD
jgi:hypothetical protein